MLSEISQTEGRSEEHTSELQSLYIEKLNPYNKNCMRSALLFFITVSQTRKLSCLNTVCSGIHGLYVEEAGFGTQAFWLPNLASSSLYHIASLIF